VQAEPDRSGKLAEPVEWAVGELLTQLRDRGIAAATTPGGHQLRVLATQSAGDPTLKTALAEKGLQLPEGPESFALVRSGDVIVAWGSDARGLVYALTELADRLRYDGVSALDVATPAVETPANRVRSIIRVFCCAATDKAWFYDRSAWVEYLSMLAYNRFNRFAMTFGMSYNYPYHNNMLRDVYFHCPYPFLVSPPGYDVKAVGLPDAEREYNLETLRFIGREAKRRGLDFQLGLWTQRYDFDEAVQTDYRITGVTEENFPSYCRDSIAEIVKACPDISGITLRIHVEGGIEEGDYKFWETYFQGVAAGGRKIDIDLHPKGLDHKMLEVARATGMPVTVSPKYIAEHMALPYHTAAIRNREYPPEVTGNIREQLSRGARKFLRYSYGDLLAKDRDWKVVFRIWPGTQKVLLWGDPAMAAGYGHSSAYCGADGIEICEPQTFRGRMGTGTAGGRHNYKVASLMPKHDWQKYLYQYRVWGRLTYFPEADRDGWMRLLRSECGSAADACETGLSYASRILPLFTQVHGPSVSNNLYFPEIYTNVSVISEGTARPYGLDSDAPNRFGNISTFDPQLFANAREYAANLAEPGKLRKYTPLDVADWFEELASRTEEQIKAIADAPEFARPAVQRIYVDLQVMAGLGRFFAGKFRGASFAEAFHLTGVNQVRLQAAEHIRRGYLGWKSAADASKDVYQDDIAFGIQDYMRGSWTSKLSALLAEVYELDSWREGDGPAYTHRGDAGRPYVEGLENRVRTISSPLPLNFPAEFKAGEAITVALDDAGPHEAPVLHYRHVNQAERWSSVPMTGSAGKYSGTIPADYTDTNFHIQFYVTSLRDNSVLMIPGLAPDLSNEPYHTIMQQ
jgi:hypothetical protein